MPTPTAVETAMAWGVIGMQATANSMPLIDWMAIVVVLGGLASGMFSGLARSFGTLLWVLAALWLGTHLAPQVVSWMPRTATPGDPHAVQTAFGLITAVVLLLPIIARIVGGAGGKKKASGEIKHKAFGALVGLISATLLFSWAAPFLYRYPVVARNWELARSPRVAQGVVENVSYLFTDGHRELLRQSLGGKKVYAVPATPEPGETPDAPPPR